MNRIFHGKVMLFGEYSVLKGSHAALVPYVNAGARLAFPGEKDNPRSNCILNSFASFLKHIHTTGGILPELDFVRLLEDIDSGLFLDSDIPEGYGLGSSGAVCAAIYWTYQKNGVSGDLMKLQSVFSAMESFFHGSSSGVDPLCIFVDQPLVIRGSDCILPALNGVYLSNSLKPFLLMEKKGSHTDSLVKNFLQRMQENQIHEWFEREYIPLVNNVVDKWQNGLLTMDDMSKLSNLQVNWFNEMIPDQLIPIWNDGLSSALYALKICGSGGGGMSLGFTEHPGETAEFMLRRFQKEIILI